MEEIKIKDYTTSISASRTMGEIEELLSGLGANAILKNYRGDGRVEALSFQYKGMGFKLPSNTEKCMECLKTLPVYRNKPRQWLEEQAERVTWRVIKDWLDAQISLIRIGQAEMQQVMLPYVWDGKHTLYDKFKESNFMLGTSSKVEEQ